MNVAWQELPHARSTWMVIPVGQILGKALIAPVTLQKAATSQAAWSFDDDVTTERMWWTLPWAMNWGREKNCNLTRAQCGHRARASGPGPQ